MARYPSNITNGQFNGQLLTNHIQSALFNMIIAQDIIGGSIHANYNLIDDAKEQAGLYGDTVLKIDTPVLTPVKWVPDSEDAVNVLAIKRPEAPKTQPITIDQFFQVMLTKDDYISKNAFGTEGAFAAYQSVLDSRLAKTKETHLNKLYNVFVGTVKGNEVNTSYTPVTVSVDLDANDIAGIGKATAGQNIAYKLSMVVDDMKDYNTKYTANGFERAFSDADIHIVWNNKYVNAVRKIDTPALYNPAVIEQSLKGKTLPSKYFGTVITSANVSDFSAATPTTGKPIDSDTGAYTPGTNNANGTIRAAKDLYKPFGTAGATVYIPAGAEIPANKTIGASSTDFLYGEVYIEQDNVICKIFTKMPPVLENFSVGSSFYNAKNLSTNMYLTYGLNTLVPLDSEAIVTLKAE